MAIKGQITQHDFEDITDSHRRCRHCGLEKKGRGGKNVKWYKDGEEVFPLPKCITRFLGKDKGFPKSKRYVGFQVVKRLPTGKIVEKYDSLREVQVAEKIGYMKLLAAIDNRTVINGHIFTLLRERPQDKEKTCKQRAWEGENGMFDIDGWATMAIPV